MERYIEDTSHALVAAAIEQAICRSLDGPAGSFVVRDIEATMSPNSVAVDNQTMRSLLLDAKVRAYQHREKRVIAGFSKNGTEIARVWTHAAWAARWR